MGTYVCDVQVFVSFEVREKYKFYFILSVGCGGVCPWMSFTAYVSDQEKSERYATYCGRVNKKKVDAVTVAKTEKRFQNVDRTNPVFNVIHRLNAQNPERLNELPMWVRRNFGDTEAIDLDDDDNDNESIDACVTSAVGVQVRGQLKQHHNGMQVGHRRTALSTYNERAGQPFQVGAVSSVIQPSADQKVSEVPQYQSFKPFVTAKTGRLFTSKHLSWHGPVNQA